MLIEFKLDLKQHFYVQTSLSPGNTRIVDLGSNACRDLL